MNSIQILTLPNGQIELNCLSNGSIRSTQYYLRTDARLADMLVDAIQWCRADAGCSTKPKLATVQPTGPIQQAIQACLREEGQARPEHTALTQNQWPDNGLGPVPTYPTAEEPAAPGDGQSVADA